MCPEYLPTKPLPPPRREDPWMIHPSPPGWHCFQTLQKYIYKPASAGRVWGPATLQISCQSVLNPRVSYEHPNRRGVPDCGIPLWRIRTKHLTTSHLADIDRLDRLAKCWHSQADRSLVVIAALACGLLLLPGDCHRLPRPRQAAAAEFGKEAAPTSGRDWPGVISSVGSRGHLSTQPAAKKCLLDRSSNPGRASIPRRASSV